MKEDYKITNSPLENFLKFENYLLNDPKTFFPAFKAGRDSRVKIIWKEFLDWQNGGGKIKDYNFKIIGDNKDIITWNFGDEHYAQQIDLYLPFSLEEYKNALSTVFSFMSDRPQYFKFRKMEGMFNPLRILLYELL